MSYERIQKNNIEEGKQDERKNDDDRGKIGFYNEKLESDRKSRYVATTDLCLQINARNTGRRNSIGSRMCILFGNS